MCLLILGGTRFVGRALVERALARGWSVTTFHRGRTGQSPPGVESIIGDRTVPGDVERLRGGRWDAVIDTWDGASRAVLNSCRVLSDSVDQYVYVSSRSVYRTPVEGMTEEAPIHQAAPDSTGGEYGELKAGGEGAAWAVFGDRVLIARAGLVLGPYESGGRLVWWLRRLARGGDVLAPGPEDLALQYIDVRDLARWLLDAAAIGRVGTFNAVSQPGQTTIGGLLRACQSVTGVDSVLHWAPPGLLLGAGLAPWTDVPIWVPPGHPLRGLHGTDATAAARAGLRCRPVLDTVAETWNWLRSTHSESAPSTPGGLNPVLEQDLLRRLRLRLLPLLLLPAG